MSNQPDITRFVVDVRDGIDPQLAFMAIQRVLAAGLVSSTGGRDHHCHHAEFQAEGLPHGAQIDVVCRSQSLSEKFIVSAKKAP